GHCVLVPEPADQPEELAGAVVAARRVELAVAVGGEVVDPGDHVDVQPPAGQAVQRGRGAREVGGLPVAGPDRDERPERRGAGGDGRGDGERVGAAPAGADQRPAPAVPLRGLGEVHRVVEGAPAVGRVVAAVTRLDGVGDVPEELVHASTWNAVNSRAASPSPTTRFTPVAAANTPTGRQPASRTGATRNSRPIETNARMRNSVRRSFTAEIASFEPPLARNTVAMIDAARKPSTNLGNRS